MINHIFVRGRVYLGKRIVTGRGEIVGAVTEILRCDGELTGVVLDNSVLFVRSDSRKTAFVRWSSIGDK